MQGHMHRALRAVTLPFVTATEHFPAMYRLGMIELRFWTRVPEINEVRFYPVVPVSLVGSLCFYLVMSECLVDCVVLIKASPLQTLTTKWPPMMSSNQVEDFLGNSEH